MAQIITKFIADSAVVANKLATDSVTNAKIANDAVTSAKIQNGAVTDAKLASTFLKADGTVALSGDLDAGGNTISNLTNPVALNDAATKDYVDTEIAGVAANTYNKQSFTLSAGDITNQYIDLGHSILANSLDFMVNGLIFREGADYTVNLTGGAGGVTRVTFAGDLATAGNAALVASDVVYVKYTYSV
jgi:hypothetical protein